jgi:hypothetical protein
MPEGKRDLWAAAFSLATAAVCAVGILGDKESTAWRVAAWVAVVGLSVASLAIAVRWGRRFYRVRWGRSERL